MSKVFTDTKVPEWVLELSNINIGGTGFYYDKAIPLPDHIEHHKPDYHLYDDWVTDKLNNGGKKLDYKYYIDYSIGFTCYDKETEVLTENGWKLFKDINFKDKLITLNPNTKTTEYHYPIEIIKTKYEGELLHFKNKYIDLLVTPNHNMYCSISNKDYKLIRADEVSKYYQYKFKKNGIYNGKAEEYFELPLTLITTSDKIKNKILMDDWLEFLGYYLSEGSCQFKQNTNSYIIKISQKKYSNKSKYKLGVYNKIKSCIEKIGYNYYENEKEGFYISNKQLYTYLKIFGLQHERYIPAFVKDLSIDQINIFINAYVDGDGVLYKRKDGKFTKGIVSCSKKIMDDFQELFFRIGYCGDIKIHTKMGDVKYLKGRKITAKHNSYIIFMNTYYTQPIYSRQNNNVNKITYDDYIYCCEVPNHILYVRRNGIAVWCGNTRGCFRKCEFCVNKKYDKVLFHSPIEEFLDEERKYICLLDDNILGYGQWKSIFDSLHNTGKRFEYKQGMDLRLMTDEKAKILNESKYIGDYIFAFDNIDDKDEIEEKLKLWRKYCIIKGQNTKLYILCAFDRNDEWDNEFWIKDIRDTFERVKILMKYNCLPYIMRYEKYKVSPCYGMYVNIASWGNQPHLYKKKSFREWCVADDKRKGENSATIKYINEFENKHPEIAKEYFDLKFDDLNEYKK